MAAHIEEQEELENFKYFWNKWGRWLFGILLLAALGYLGYVFYQSQQNKQNQEAAGVLIQMVEKEQQSKNANINADLQNLQQNYPDSIAAAQATLMAATKEFDNGKYDIAAGHLNWVLKNQKSPPVQALAVQRLAVVKLQQNKFDEALAVLGTKVDKAFEPLLLETKGDVYAAQGKNKEAVQAYEQALAQMPDDAFNRENIQFKADQLQ
ncbi:YfgM family protein [Neisseria montereyensis]|uniref:Ancillary SecYEG translocon subunit n=1 Tax=Neisseria montereyensis TaxID=2973938 RepID=A0ABT2FD68_9NEIS|nr:tetratricopeptide repeat protein [Neisseria montereyensis]MCS4533463.1 tetratricopeptide repeat protein [Neisseria montereyensis]